MPEYLSPGVYVEEVSSGSKPIEGVSTSTAGFLGATERGPEPPRMVTSWLEFQSWYGGYIPDKSYLAYAVEGFFANGGQRCFIARIVSGSDETAKETLSAAEGDGGLDVYAIGRGAWGNKIEIMVEPASNPPEGKAWVKVTISGYGAPEVYDNLTHEVGASNNIEIVLNSASHLVRVAWNGEPTPLLSEHISAVEQAEIDAATTALDNAKTAATTAETALQDAKTEADTAVADAKAKADDAKTKADAAAAADPPDPALDAAADAAATAAAEAQQAADDAADAVQQAVLDSIVANNAVKDAEENLAETKAKAAPANYTLEGGKDGAPIIAPDFDGDLLPIPEAPGVFPAGDLLGRGRGLAAMATVDEISLLLIPDEVREGFDAVTSKAIIQCEQLKDRFAIVSAHQGQSDTNPVRPPQDTSYAAFYYPWIQVFDPSINSTRLVPPLGHVAGIFARTDIERGVHKAPANEVVRGARNPEFAVTKGMQDILNPRGVNCIRDFRSDSRGIRLWGARTMSSDPEWKYVNVRRLFLFVEESIDEGTQWVVFEPNDDATWAKVRRNLTNFLVSVWRSGALMGTTQDEAFFVKCDRTTMTQDDIDNGRLICYIGIAPVKPAEFVIFRISQKTGDAPA